MLDEDEHCRVFRSYDQYKESKPHASIHKLQQLEQSSNLIALQISSQNISDQDQQRDQISFNQIAYFNKQPLTPNQELMELDDGNLILKIESDNLLTKESSSSKQSSAQRLKPFNLPQQKLIKECMEYIKEESTQFEDRCKPIDQLPLNNKPQQCPFSESGQKRKESMNDQQREILKQQYLKLKQELKELTQKQQITQQSSSTKKSPKSVLKQDDANIKLRSTSMKIETAPTTDFNSKKASLNHSRNQKIIDEGLTKVKNPFSNKTHTQQASNKSSFNHLNNQASNSHKNGQYTNAHTMDGRNRSSFSKEYSQFERHSTASSKFTNTMPTQHSRPGSKNDYTSIMQKNNNNNSKPQVFSSSKRNSNARPSEILYQQKKPSMATMQYPKINKMVTSKYQGDSYKQKQNFAYHRMSSVASNTSSQQSLSSHVFKTKDGNNKKRHTHYGSHQFTQKVFSQTNLLSKHKDGCCRNQSSLSKKKYKNEEDCEDYRERAQYSPKQIESRSQSRCRSSQSSNKKKKCKRCHHHKKSRYSELSHGRPSQCSLGSTESQQYERQMDEVDSCSNKYGKLTKAVHKIDLDLQQKSLSPQRLNKELNKILETERMIKEYKEMITKMQRDMYSKKNSHVEKEEVKNDLQQQLHNSHSIKLQRKVFEEDINPQKSIQNIVAQSYLQNTKRAPFQSRNNENESMQKSKTEDNSQNKSKSISLIVEQYVDTDFNQKSSKDIKTQQISQLSQHQAAFNQIKEAASNPIMQQKTTFVLNDKTIIPEEEWENTCLQGGNEDESILNLQQQQAILNFYNEFQDDDSLKTPVSGFSGKASFLMTSSTKKKGKSSMFSNNENVLPVQIQKVDEVKTVSIQIQGQKKSGVGPRISDIHRIGGYQQPSRKSPLLQSYQSLLGRSNTPSKVTQVDTSQKSSILQNLLYKSQNFSTQSWQTFSQAKPISPQQKLIPKPYKPSTNLSISNSKPLATSITQSISSPVAQILYKKTFANSSNLNKLLSDSQKRSAKNKDMPRPLTTTMSQVKCQTIDLSAQMQNKSRPSSKLSTALATLRPSLSGQSSQRQSLGTGGTSGTNSALNTYGTYSNQTPVAKLSLKLF